MDLRVTGWAIMRENYVMENYCELKTKLLGRPELRYKYI